MNSSIVTPLQNDTLHWRSFELSWKEYIDSLTPEELELERESKRHWAKVWYQNKKEKKQEYSKEYYMKNKDKKQEYAKEYNMKNKDLIAEASKERERPKVVCECCGSIYTRSQAQRQFRNQKHQNAVEAQNQQIDYMLLMKYECASHVIGRFPLESPNLEISRFGNFNPHLRIS